MKTVMEFNTLVIVETKMITYNFFCGVLHRMHDRPHLTMVVFSQLSANFDCFSLVPAKVTGR